LLKSPNNLLEDKDGGWETPENQFGSLIPVKLDIEIDG
jgi:hypothetical protein